MAKDLAALVMATTSFSTVLKGVSIEVRQGHLYHANGAIARTYPQFFGPPVIRDEDSEEVIEQATARPGEKRGA
jgi:hypothetical protein